MKEHIDNLKKIKEMVEVLDDLEESLKRLPSLRKMIKEIFPYGKIKEVKQFSKSGHIILPERIIGKKVVVLELDDLEN